MDKGYLLFDGAFGTYYAAKNPGGRACELANVEALKRCSPYTEYIEAGAQAVKTNTFAANGAYIPDRGSSKGCFAPATLWPHRPQAGAGIRRHRPCRRHG